MSRANQTRFEGVVEGFYGRPWTTRQRQQLFGWLRAAGLNAYLYAPKDDLKHRTLWREPYTSAEAAELRALAWACNQQGLQFIYAIAPGLDIVATKAEDLAALRAKLDQVRDLGAVHCAVLWDDIPARLSGEDQRAFGTAAGAQCAVTNAVFDTFRQVSAQTRLLFCPTVYCGRMAEPSVLQSPYLKEVGEKLRPEIDFLWTGPEIISEVIPVESIRELRQVIRRPPVLWDNLHANDYDLRRLHLGPYAGRTPELQAEIGGILLNPNCQFEANFVPVHTLGAYCQSEGDSDERAHYRRALVQWLPAFAGRTSRALAIEALELLGDLLYLPSRLGDRAQAYLADLTLLLRTSPEQWGEAQARFEQTSRDIAGLYDRLTELQDRDLLYALYPQVWELKEIALLLMAWVHWRRHAAAPDVRFRSPDFRPRIFRGGFAATIERLLPMDEDGRFTPTS
jgi:protein O-GlcNAcase/histone acetyltransferase